MRMTAQCKLRRYYQRILPVRTDHIAILILLLINSRRPGLAPLFRNMLQHQHERARSDAIQRLPYVGSLWLVIVLCTSHIDAVSTSMHRHMLIHQQVPSATPLEVLHPLL